jgi:hypothetical protein
LLSAAAGAGFWCCVLELEQVLEQVLEQHLLTPRAADTGPPFSQPEP